MLRNYLKIAIRSLARNKVHSFINIAGLSVGMTVAMLIGLWIWDELSFDTYNKNYDRIAKVMQNQVFNGNIATWGSMPYPLGAELRKDYGGNFKYVVTSTGAYKQLLTSGTKKLNENGIYMEPDAPEMLDLTMLSGSRAGLKDPSSILLSQSAAKAYFGDTAPLGKLMRIDSSDLKVTGVYKDLPANSGFADIDFIAPWAFRFINDKWLNGMDNPWGNNSFQVFVQLADNMGAGHFSAVSAKIRNVKLDHIRQKEKIGKAQLFLLPISRWHLYSEYKNGVNVGGRIEFVWLFGIIGVFVLILACINFMNLSTARSEKRAKEVGIRKAIGGLRSQLIGQFFSESLLMVTLAFVLSLALVQLTLPFFNEVADKKITVLWNNPLFWLAGIGFSLLTGLIAGSYPALYLSSFQPVKVLKGAFRVGKLAVIPRKVLVVVQFTVSVALIIGTVIVFRQVQFARDRPVGYSREGLIATDMYNPAFHQHFDAIKNELINAGAIAEMAESSNPLTEVWRTNGGFDWKGKDPGLAVNFPANGVSFDYGKLTGWQIMEGRDFSKDFPSDSSAFILNETAAKFIGLKDPVGETIRWSDGVAFKVIGIVKDMIMESPYEPVRPSLYFLARNTGGIVNIKINSRSSIREAIAKIGSVFSRYNQGLPFEYRFVDEDYAKKFGNEERIGRLAGFFAILAIFISCLGLFGMASFMAEQRTREIGVRKVLGASVFSLWRLLSREFVGLVFLSLFIAVPLAWYFMNGWLAHYQYHTALTWWIFAATGAGALGITLLTVSFQAIRAALANPVKSLKTE
jgi:putative ABC transport system permease protein